MAAPRGASRGGRPPAAIFPPRGHQSPRSARVETDVYYDNIHKTSPDHNRYNFSLRYFHLGRSLYNKFYNWDLELEYDDNTFNEIIARVGISLTPPETIPYSNEYIRWCNRHNQIPSGNHINIGNIPDLQHKLLSYRQLIYRNVENNFKIIIK